MKKQTILIVEDEPSLMQAMADKLSREKFTVLKAANGKEGLETALQRHPDLILLDLIMPVMGGIETLENLRKDNWGKTAKIIVLTNLNDKDKITETMRKKVSDYLVKTDCSLEELVKLVKTRLDIK